MPPSPPTRPRLPIRVVLSSTALLPFVSVWKAAALAVAELGVAAFLISGVTAATLGGSAPWFVLAAAAIVGLARAADIESWGLLIPGGFIGSVRRALGPRAAHGAAAATLVERLLLSALAAVLIGHYAVGLVITVPQSGRLTRFAGPEDLANVIAVFAVGLLWIRARLGRGLSRDALARGVWVGVGILLTVMVWGVVTVVRARVPAADTLTSAPPLITLTGIAPLDLALTLLLGFSLTLPVVGGGDALARSAHEFAPPRITALRRISRLTWLFTLAVTLLSSVVFTLLVPDSERLASINAPLEALVPFLSGPVWRHNVGSLAIPIRGAVPPLGPRRRACRHPTHAAAMVARWPAPFRPGRDAHQVRHARQSRRRHRDRDDSDHPGQRWPRHVAGPRLRHRRRRHAGTE